MTIPTPPAPGSPLTYHTPGTAAERFAHPQYVVRKKVLTIAGAKFHVYDMAGNVVMFTKQKAFKLKEDIRLYTGEDMQTELLRIQARKVIDFSAAYDVVDVPANQKLGAFKRKGLKSLLRDEWIVMDAYDREIGLLVEDSTALALVRRFIDLASLLLPQKFHAEIGGATAATFQQNYNPFVRKLMADFSMDPAGRLDRRLGLAAATLLSAIEGRQG